MTPTTALPPTLPRTYPLVFVVLAEDLGGVVGAAVGEEHDDAVTVGAVAAGRLGALVEALEVLEGRLEAYVIVRHVVRLHRAHVIL